MGFVQPEAIASNWAFVRAVTEVGGYVGAVRIGLLGLGTVGGGTVNVLARNATEIERRCGRRLQVAKACARDLSKPRICPTDGIALTEHPRQVVDDPASRYRRRAHWWCRCRA